MKLRLINGLPFTVVRITFFNCSYVAFKHSLPESERSAWYPERYFNEKQLSDLGFKSFDRQIGNYDRYKLEFTDLYKEGTLYFVKIGTPQKLNYVIDQSIAVVKYLIEHRRKISLNGELLEPNEICIWLVLDRRTEIKKITDLRSFIFLMKINDWRKQVENAKFKPKIIVSFKE